MAARIYAGEVTADGLETLVENLRPQAPYAVLEKVDDVGFPAGSEAIDPAAWDEGHIFGPALELHWSCIGDDFRAVLTREDDGDGDGLPQVELLEEPGYERKEHAYYLWGEEDTRIGRKMEYHAIPGGGRVQLVVAEFYDGAGELRHWRYVRLQREEDL
ncbi:MAG TPA: hypothetical protein ENI90_02040 [Methylothermaceae bacterium]|nr:hypothetical protein [Methylothermaceae bacterium]